MITLHQILEAGFDEELGYTYAILVAFNSLSCVVVICMHSKISAFGEVLVDMTYAWKSLLIHLKVICCFCQVCIDLWSSAV